MQFDELPQGFEEAAAGCYEGDGGGLAAGEDEGCAGGEFGGGADFDEFEIVVLEGGGVGGGALEEGDVFYEGALEG